MGFRLPSVIVLALWVAASSVGRAGDFAIETRVFVEGQKELRSHNVTIFSDRRVSDFSLVPAGHITVFDRDSKRFLMIDTQRRVQTSLTVDELIRFVAIEQAAAAKSEFDLIRFAASPKFETTFDTSNGELRLSSNHWEYRVATLSALEPLEQSRYDDFANWFTQLNALFNPMPPGARMELNRELETRRLFPERVEALIKKDGRVEYRQESRHRLVPEIGERERGLLGQWEQARAISETIAFHEYRLTQLPPKSKP